MKTQDSIVTLATFSNQFEAAVAQGMLKNHGIESMISNELTSSMLGSAGYGAFGGVNLSVFERDYDAARSLLDAHKDI